MKKAILINETKLTPSEIQDAFNKNGYFCFLPETSTNYASGFEVNGNYVNIHTDYFENCVDMASSEWHGSYYLWEIDNYQVILFINYNNDDELIIADKGEHTIEEIVKSWAEEISTITSFGFDPDLKKANEESEDVRIFVKYHYYYNHLNAPINDWLKDDNGEIIEFDRYQDASDYIEEIENAVYYLKHGEYSIPDYTICE